MPIKARHRAIKLDGRSMYFLRMPMVPKMHMEITKFRVLLVFVEAIGSPRFLNYTISAFESKDGNCVQGIHGKKPGNCMILTENQTICQTFVLKI